MPSPEESINCWLSIIERGRVTSTYKLALGFAIAQLVEEGKRQVSMRELAQIFFDLYLERLKYELPQTSNPDEPTIVEQAVTEFKNGSLTMQKAIDAIEKDGFKYVLDAFHRLPGGESPIKFYHRTGLGIMLTDAAYKVFWSPQKDHIIRKMDARWSELEEGFARRALGSNVLTWVASNKSVAGANDFLWCRANASEGSITHIGGGMSDFADRIISDLISGYKVALGFEHPLYIDVAKNPDERALFPGEESRVAEGSGSPRHLDFLPRNGFAPGLSETAWVFEKVRTGIGRGVTPTFRWRSLIDSEGNLFIWEAVVASERNKKQHGTNAEVATRSFLRLYPRLPIPEITEDRSAFSLACAALMWAGYRINPKALHSPCVVVRVS